MARDNFYREHWGPKRRALTDSRIAGSIEVSCAGSRLLVSVPYTDAFRDRVRLIEGVHWRHRTGRWSVPRTEHKALVALITEIYGADKVPTWMVPCHHQFVDPDTGICCNCGRLRP